MKNESEALAAVVATNKYDTPSESQNFHIRLEDPIGQQALRRALNTAGITAIVTPASHERNGVILTDLLAYITWESQTENYNCDGSCRKTGNPPHTGHARPPQWALSCPKDHTADNQQKTSQRCTHDDHQDQGRFQPLRCQGPRLHRPPLPQPAPRLHQGRHYQRIQVRRLPLLLCTTRLPGLSSTGPALRASTGQGTPS